MPASADIQRRLSDAKRRRKKLDDEINALEEQLSQCHAVATISSCPVEILLDIFKRVIVGNPQHVKRLLTVCWQWYKIVTSSPLMWTHISIGPPSITNTVSWVSSTQPFVAACLKHSSSHPLEVHLDLVSLLTSARSLKSRMFELISNDLNAYPHTVEQLHDWVESVDCRSVQSSQLRADTSPEPIITLITRLFETVRQIRSLDIVFPQIPSRQTTLKVWNQLCRKALDPLILSLVNLDLEGLRRHYDTERIPPLDATHVTDLSVDHLCQWDQFLVITPAALRRLHVGACFEDDFYMQLERFSALKVLTLGAFAEVQGISGRIHLPHLQELIIDCSLDTEIPKVTFDLPMLESLVWKWGWEWSASSINPASAIINPLGASTVVAQVCLSSCRVAVNGARGDSPLVTWRISGSSLPESLEGDFTLSTSNMIIKLEEQPRAG